MKKVLFLVTACASVLAACGGAKAVPSDGLGALVEKRDNPMQGWLNCTCSTLSALSELAAAESNVWPR